MRDRLFSAPARHTPLAAALLALWASPAAWAQPAATAAPATEWIADARGTATLWSTYAITPEIEVGGGAIAVSSRFANNTDLLRVPGYTRWDATLAWRQPRYDIRLNIFNLTDKHYYDALIPSDGGCAVPSTSVTGMLSFTYRM